MTIIRTTGMPTINWAALRPAQHPPAQPRPATALGDATSATRSDSLYKKWDEGRQALDALARAPDELRQSRKAFAAEMIRRIKEQLKHLLMIGGDARANARQIALLARQLAAAAQEYAAALDGPRSADTASTDSAPLAQAVGATPEQSAEPAEATAATTTAAPATAAPAPATNSGTTSEQTTTDNQTLQTEAGARNKVAAYTDNLSDADRDFIREVKKLAAQLKALAKLNDVSPRRDTPQSTAPATESTEEALKEVEKSLARIEDAGSAASTSLDIVAK